MSDFSHQIAMGRVCISHRFQPNLGQHMQSVLFLVKVPKNMLSSDFHLDYRNCDFFFYDLIFVEIS